ncbi:hypothetical protein N7456_002747 [Penicillium angulare]|uniref:Uncharacterized protein n=1 Tax=Penicillium angulare TaxID=116970 RepID=A0A9W9G9A2_9EURO|nr:hypothetical protein N7456_002747 [Penicillium angulare]
MYNKRANPGPSFKNVRYSSEDLDQLPVQPVLSILHFLFHGRVDILDVSQSASLLWSRSLQFVSTIPGFERLFWAPVNDASSDQEVIVLIQWDSQQSWSRFQCSLGFSMMLGFISKISNRCIQLALASDISSLACRLELVSFTFWDIPSDSQLEKQTEFKEKWETAFPPDLKYSTPGNKLISVCGEWLQRDYDFEDHFFVGLIFWESSAHANSPQLPQDINTPNIAGHLKSLVDDATEIISVYTSQLNHVSIGFSPVPDVLPFRTNHQLFKTRLKPKFSLNKATDPEGKDMFHLESAKQAGKKPAERIAVAPAGLWCPMGIMSQYRLPRPLTSASEPSLEMISFFAQRWDEKVAISFSGLRKKIWELYDYPQMFWGKNQSKIEGNENILLFINLRTFQRSEEVRMQLERHMQEFMDESSDTVQNISHRRIVGPSQLRPAHWHAIEITTFDVPVNNCKAFEYAHFNYGSTTHQQHIPRSQFGPWSAIIPYSQGWVPGKEPGTMQYMSSLGSNKEGAREEWYSDFANRAQTEYDLLGHIVDWVRALSTCISVQYVVPEPEDPWVNPAPNSLENHILGKELEWTPDKLRKEQPADAVVPRHIFDLPWAKHSDIP